MKYIFSFFLYSLLLFSCNNPKSNEEYFEGKIEYKVSYNPHNAKTTEARLLDTFGSKMIYSFKEGNYMKEYYSREGDLVLRTIYNREENQLYMIRTDTVFTYSPARSPFKLTKFEQRGDDVVLNKVCHYYYIENDDSISQDKIIHEFYFDPSLKVDPVWYTKFTDGGWDKIMGKAKSLSLKFTNDTKFFKQIHTASKVESGSIDLADFKVDDTLPKKYLN